MNHVGTVGERITLTVTTHSIEPVETEFGEVGIHHMTTEGGNQLQWNASSEAKRLPVRQAVTVKATIKDHDYDDVGRPLTHVWRVKEHTGEEQPVRTQKCTIGIRPGIFRQRRR